MRMKALLGCGAAIAAVVAAPSNAAVINLIDGGFAGNAQQQAQFRAGFKIAADYWGSILTNNAVINLNVGTQALGTGIIGSTGSTRANFTTANWASLVNSTKSGSTIDTNIVLPTLTTTSPAPTPESPVLPSPATTGGLSFITNGVGADGNDDLTTQRYIADSSYSSRVLYLNSSLIKALGGTAAGVNSTSVDGTVRFSTNFNFDFDPTDGITANTFDFIAVAIHEIGHALGFVSGVDFLDVYGVGPGSSPNEGVLGYSLNNTAIYSALDMFRYSNDPNNLAPGNGPAHDLSVGGTKYFSVDGGATALFGNTFSTGRYNGDGQQASHWKDAAGCQIGNGLLDPTFCFGQTGFVTGLDLAAYDAMGWNLSVNALTYANTSTATIYRQFAVAVPEPTTWAMLIFGFGLVGGSMRRRNVKVSYAV